MVVVNFCVFKIFFTFRPWISVHRLPESGCSDASRTFMGGALLHYAAVFGTWQSGTFTTTHCVNGTCSDELSGVFSPVRHDGRLLHGDHGHLPAYLPETLQQGNLHTGHVCVLVPARPDHDHECNTFKHSHLFSKENPAKQPAKVQSTAIFLKNFFVFFCRAGCTCLSYSTLTRPAAWWVASYKFIKSIWHTYTYKLDTKTELYEPRSGNEIKERVSAHVRTYVCMWRSWGP